LTQIKLNNKEKHTVEIERKTNKTFCWQKAIEITQKSKLSTHFNNFQIHTIADRQIEHNCIINTKGRTIIGHKNKTDRSDEKRIKVYIKD